MDYHGRVMDLLPNAYFSKADIRGDAAAIAKEADMELAELRLDRQRKDAEIARMREALQEIANPLNISRTYHEAAIRRARAALAPAAEVSGG